MYRTVRVSILVAALILLVAVGATAQAPSTIQYQGKLSDATGPITSAVDVTFRIYDAESAGTLLWVETHNGLTPDDLGVFTVELGSIVPFGPGVFGGQPRYLGITVGADDEMSPRQLISAVPYSLSSPGFAGVWKGYASVSVTLEGKDTLEIQVPGPGFVVVQITGNFNAYHSTGITGWIVATIDTLSAAETDWNSWAYYSFDSELPTGYYANPYAATRVVPVSEAGLYTFYTRAQFLGLSNGNLEECYFWAVYYPTYLGTDLPHPPAVTFSAGAKGPGALEVDR